VISGSVKGVPYTLATGLANVTVAVSIGSASAALSELKQGANVVLVHKLVNIKSSEQVLSVSITGLPSSAKLNPVLDVVALTGTSPTQENTLAMPNAVSPKYSNLTVSGPAFDITLPPWSCLVVRAYATI